MKSFGDKLHDIRLEKGFISARKTAEKLGISNVYLHEIEADIKIPSNDVLSRMAKLYEVDPVMLTVPATARREKTPDARRLAVARYIMNMPEDEFNRLTQRIGRKEKKN